jgi:hypothetical protein
VISDEHLPLEVVWPEVHRRLLRFLHARGTDASMAEDIVQDVALRVVALDVPYESADDLMRWAATAARNLAIDQWRADSRYRAVPLEEAASAVDVDETVEHRLRLEAVGHSWMQLSQRDRDALRSGALGTKAGSRSEGVRWAVQRHAARARLAAMIDGVSGVLVWLGAKLRYRPRKPGRAVAVASLPALAVVVALVPYAIDVLTPHVRGDAPTREGRRLDHSAEGVSTGSASPRATAERPQQLPGRRAERSAEPVSRNIVPYRQVEVGHERDAAHRLVYTRPKRPDDSLVCYQDLPVAGSRCFNPPLPPLPLLKLVPAPPPLPPPLSVP